MFDKFDVLYRKKKLAISKVKNCRLTLKKEKMLRSATGLTLFRKVAYKMEDNQWTDKP